MRVSFVLLVAVASLLVSNDLVSATPSSNLVTVNDNNHNARSLKSHKTTSVLAADEERAAEERAAQKIIDAKILANIESDHAYAKQVFRSWLQNGQSKEDIESRLKTLGLLAKYSNVVKQYGQYLTVLESKNA